MPILFLTARDAVPDRVAGLDAGGDDYLVKPFATDELEARLRALLRRGRTRERRLLRRSDRRHRRPYRFTRRPRARADRPRGRPFALLVNRAGQVVSREQALAAVWGEGRLPTANTVDRYVAYLRSKLGDPPLIHTVRGVGFQLRQ